MRRLAAFTVTAATVAVTGTAVTVALFGGLDATQRAYAVVAWACLGVSAGLAVVTWPDPPADGDGDG